MFASHGSDQEPDFFFSSGSLGRAKNASSSHSPIILRQTLRYEPSKLMCFLSGWSKLSLKLANSSAISPDWEITSRTTSPFRDSFDLSLRDPSASSTA